MIAIQNLTKMYGKTEVLHNIDLHVRRKQIHGIVGISGAGKSTLLRCINGLEHYEKGHVHVDGIDIAQLSGYELRGFQKRIGMIFQNFALLERKNVFDNIALPLECWGTPKRHAQDRVKALLDLVGIPDKIHALPKHLSGGQKQRVAIARALALEPEILLCDEATSALDPATTQSVLRLLLDINKRLGVTMVFVTHEMNVVKTVCDTMSIIEKGKMVANGSVSDIFRDEPKALSNLVGSAEILIPHGQVGIKLHIGADEMRRSILSLIGEKLDISYSLLSAQVEVHKNIPMGNVLIGIPIDEETTITNFLLDTGTKFSIIPVEGREFECLSPRNC